MPLTKKRAETKKPLKKASLPKDLKMKKHPNTGEHFKDLRIVRVKDAPKGHPQFPKIDPHCVDEVVYVVDVKKQEMVWLATKMPDGRYAAWSGCSKCMHRAQFCTCPSGVLEPRTMRWMHSRILLWQSGKTVEETKAIPVDYRPWEKKPTERETLDMSRFIDPAKRSKPKGKPLRKSAAATKTTAPKTADRQAAVQAATADIDNLDLGKMNKEAASRANEVSKSLGKGKSLRKRRD